MKKYFPAIVCFLFLVSCTDEVIEPQNERYDQYYKADTSFTYYYQLDSVIYNDFDPGQVDSTTSYLKVEVADPFTDEAGEMVYKLKRYWSKSEFGPWTPGTVWTVRKLETGVHLSVGNVKYVKMIFPVKEGKSWDGNAYNSLGEELYTYKNVHKPLTMGDLQFDSTATVIERADSNLIFQDKMSSVYASGVGLVRSEHTELETQPDPEDPNIVTRNGYITRQSLLRYELK